MTCKCVLNELTRDELIARQGKAAVTWSRCRVCDKAFSARTGKVFCSDRCRIKHAVDHQLSKEQSTMRELKNLYEENGLLLEEIKNLKQQLAEAKGFV